jgi:nicotinamide-nucleotide amidase
MTDDSSTVAADALQNLAGMLGRALRQRGLRMASAESCTGGMIAATCTAQAGSSDWFDCGIVSYSLDAKITWLGIDAALLESPGPVSEPVARNMALGVLARSAADVAVATTGVAGPGGGDPALPVGTVWMAWARRGDGGIAELAQTARYRFSGTRRQICDQAVRVALEGMLDLLS